jgi:excisionase family DNA binding protein
MEPEIFTTAEVAKLLKISRRAVQWLIQQRKLKAVRIGNGYRVRQSAIDDFFEKYETKTIADAHKKEIA